MLESIVASLQKQAQSHFVYLIREGDTPYHKIGISKNPENRRAALQSSHGNVLHIIETVDMYDASGSRRLESALHQMLDGSRMHGEWFDFTPEEADRVVFSMRVLSKINCAEGQHFRAESHRLEDLLKDKRRALDTMRRRICMMQSRFDAAHHVTTDDDDEKIIEHLWSIHVHRAQMMLRAGLITPAQYDMWHGFALRGIFPLTD